MHRLAVIVAIAAATALVGTGCGASAGTATEGGGPAAHRAATSSDRTADGVRALLRQFVGDLRAGRSADACRLATPSQRAKLAAATHASCPAALDAVRKAVGIAELARDEQKIDALPVTVSDKTAASPNPEAPGETSHYVYAGGRWRIG